MTREEAIREIVGVWNQRDSEFCCSQSERDESRRELAEVLRALGVCEEEIASAVV